VVCPHGQGEEEGLSQCGNFSDKGGKGQFFTILCERLLLTAPYQRHLKKIGLIKIDLTLYSSSRLLYIFVIESF